jgi:medium-chain acyl-[acyl-carrier-protein] hydrolase
MTEINLYCFPYAGAGTAGFRAWARELAPGISVQPVILPGRDARAGDPLLQSFDEALDYFREEVIPALAAPYAFYGHSMGALLAFEAAHEAQRRGAAPLMHLLVSGSSAPQFGPRPPISRDLSDDEFMERIRELGGTPPQVLHNRELVEFVLPILRADFAVAETYVYRPRAPLPVPISVWGGGEDEPTENELRAWQDQAAGRFRLRMLPGGHFFIHSARTPFLGALQSDLRETMRRARDAGELVAAPLEGG